jgi:hypothetical protein
VSPSPEYWNSSPQLSSSNQPIEIGGDDLLYRRLGPDHVNADGTVNSNAFKLHGRPDPEISVDLARLTTPEQSLSRAPNDRFRLGVMQAGAVRELKLVVRHKPIDDNESHSVIEGAKSKKECRLLAEITSLMTVP